MRRSAAKLVNLLCLLAVLALSPTLTAHPYHASQAELELNPETGRLEVALEVIPEDLERALRKRSGQRVVLETTPAVDEMITRYLEDRFVVVVDGKNQSLRWVGKEVSAEGCWLYFEMELSEGLAETERATEWSKAILRNTVLFELEQTQVNTVRVKIGDERRSLVFNRQQPSLSLIPQQPAVDSGD